MSWIYLFPRYWHELDLEVIINRRIDKYYLALLFVTTTLKSLGQVGTRTGWGSSRVSCRFVKNVYYVEVYYKLSPPSSADSQTRIGGRNRF